MVEIQNKLVYLDDYICGLCLKDTLVIDGQIINDLYRESVHCRTCEYKEEKDFYKTDRSKIIYEYYNLIGVELGENYAEMPHPYYACSLSDYSSYIYLPEIYNYEFFVHCALHELSHWTGHRDRLQRKESESTKTVDHYKEELIAELGKEKLYKIIPVNCEPKLEYDLKRFLLNHVNPEDIEYCERQAELVEEFIINRIKLHV